MSRFSLHTVVAAWRARLLQSCAAVLRSRQRANGWSGHSACLENGLAEMSPVWARKTHFINGSFCYRKGLLIFGFRERNWQERTPRIVSLMSTFSCQRTSSIQQWNLLLFWIFVGIKLYRFWCRAIYIYRFPWQAFNFRGVHVTPQPWVCGMRREAICRQVKRGQPKSSCK